MRNGICHKYERLINDEVATGQHFTYLYIKELQQQELTDNAKRAIGISPKTPQSLYNIAQRSIAILPKIRLIYLLTLIEAFGKEYIADRDNVAIDELKKHLSAEQSAWNKQESGLRASTSFLNVQYLGFVLAQKYGITYSSKINSCFWEIGPLRNCIVHKQGIIENEMYKEALSCTIKEIGVAAKTGEELIITEPLLWVLIESSREFIESCDF